MRQRGPVSARKRGSTMPLQPGRYVHALFVPHPVPPTSDSAKAGWGHDCTLVLQQRLLASSALSPSIGACAVMGTTVNVAFGQLELS